MTDEPVGIIGGSGFYALLGEAEAPQTAPDTPYGPASGPVSHGSFGDRAVAFLPRHGVDHRFAPHVVPYRANLWLLRSVGVRQVISLSAVGSLRADLGVGTLVVPDQLADRTHGRAHTYYNTGTGVSHAPFADPFCPRGRAAALRGAPRVTDGGTLVVVNGPRFSTRAESLEFQAHRWSIIGMTAMPEAALARELGLCYTTLAMVTDLDAGVEAGEGVRHEDVLASFAQNLPRLRGLLLQTLAALPLTQDDCGCGQLAGTPVP
jgi:5'-methylthioadenosine phosphorylase